MWMELKRDLQFSAFLMDSHAIQAFVWLKQGLDELLDMYLHCTSELLSRMYHTSDMSRISALGSNHYAVVYDLKCRKLKNYVMGHSSTQWKTMEDCLRDICNL